MEMSKKMKFREYMESIAVAVILALLIRTFIIQAFKIPSSSMENTLKVGDHILVVKFLYGTHIPYTDLIGLSLKKPSRKEVIVFKYPLDPSRDFIKRCIGLPGESIAVRDNKVYVNDKSIDDEPYAIHKYKNAGAGRDYNPVTVPMGHYFMMGDNRDNSSDSRVWGFLSFKGIKGKALLVYWPPRRIRLIK